MNTIIINKIMMHMLDFEHRKIYLSEDFCELNDTTQEYYHKKVEKAYTVQLLKNLLCLHFMNYYFVLIRC